MNGVLGSWNLYASVPQAIYVNNNTEACILNINVCNRNHVEVKVSIALSISATSPINSEYIEYEAPVFGKGVLERTGIAVGSGQFVVVESSSLNVAASCWGIEIGSALVSPTTLTQNSVAPVWSTAATLPDITSSGFVTIPLRAS
jgi:hypothetical protein